MTRRARRSVIYWLLLSPLVVVTTLALLGSGIVLGEERSRSPVLSPFGSGVNWVDLHQALFVVFAVVGGLHLLARLVPALALTTRRLRARSGLPSRVPGGVGRGAVVVLSLAVAGVAAALLVPLASGWAHEDFHGGPPGASGHR